MKLEVGKWYRSRHGKKFFVGMRVPHKEGTCCEFAGYGERGSVISWSEDGHFWPDRGEHECDLVSEWREPRSITVDVYMVEESGVWYSSTGPIGHRPSYGTIRGVKRITINEGDGMEEEQCSANL